MTEGAPASTANPVYRERFWAKAQPYRQRGPERIHLLEHHLADVGACLEALLAQPTIRHRLARTAGRDSLDAATLARLCVFAALHDIGKVNRGFQTQVWERSELIGADYRQRAGHTLDIAPVLTSADRETAGWFFDALGWTDFTAWDDRGGEVVSDLLVATLSHHGLPLQLDGPRQANPAIWRSFEALDPARCVRRIAQLARTWFPAAWSRDVPPLPAAPEFQHMFLGLCTLADWLGSNERWFPFRDDPEDGYIATARDQARRAVRKSGLDIAEQRLAFAAAGALPPFAELFGIEGATANAIQRQAVTDTALDERLVVIESETGSGKTEAALWRFARMYEASLVDGMYFALPTRAAATQIHGRIERFADLAFPDGHVTPVVLAVPGYVDTANGPAHLLQPYEVWWDGHLDSQVPWAAEHSKRYLAAQIAVGTIDQAMMAALKVRHSHMRAACLSRNLLVIDEVHASDRYMGVIVRALLDAHLGAGGYAILMSATLGSAARREWLASGRTSEMAHLPLEDALGTPYPAVSTPSGTGELITPTGENGPEKHVRVDSLALMDDFGGVAARALDAARAGAKVLIVRNTVDYAVRIQQAIERTAGPNERGLLFSCGGVPALHHGRFVRDDRRLLDDAVETRLGKQRAAGGLIVVGTQTLEQSLDIDADLLITDLCPVDVLLQRIGRLHRHTRGRPAGFAEPVCLVLTPGDDDLTPLLARGANGLNQFVYGDLRVLEATRRLIGGDSWTIPRMNRELVERATHRDALDEITEELGGRWREHANRVMGVELAEGLTARHAVVRRDKSFCADNEDVLFGSVEERIRTRLGDEGIEIELEAAGWSPFEGSRITSITLPRRWLPGQEEWDDAPASAAPDRDGFTFRFAGRTFRYDRFGLRREVEPRRA